MSPRLTAVAALALLVGAAIVVVLGAVDAFPRGALAGGVLVAALLAAGEAVRHRGTGRTVFLGTSVALLVAAIVITFTGGLILEALVAIGCLAASAALAARLFTARTHLAPVRPPDHPVVIWNPRSGGGKALAANLADEARARGIRRALAGSSRSS